ncbi:acyl carrier protein [Spirosoma jeollabukense]
MITFTHLCRYIDQQFTLPTPDIKPDHRLQTDLGLNAMEVTEVVVFLELLYGVTLPDETLTPSLSVTQLCSLIEHYRNSQQADSAFLVYRNPRLVFSRARLDRNPIVVKNLCWNSTLHQDLLLSDSDVQTIRI